MPDLWKEVTAWLAEATRSAIKETEDLARRGKMKFDVLGINTLLQEKFAALGGVIYSMVNKGINPPAIFKDSHVKRIITEIMELEITLKETKNADTASGNEQVVKKQAGEKTRQTKGKVVAGKSATPKSSARKSSKTNKTKR
jgi:hypothetical protein